MYQILTLGKKKIFLFLIKILIIAIESVGGLLLFVGLL
jgi:hypothetical protein